MSRKTKKVAAKSTSAGMRVRVALDTEALARMRQRLELPPETPGKFVAAMPAVVETRTTEQVAIAEAGKLAARLLQTSARVGDIAATLIAARQVYATAYRELQASLDAVRADWSEVQAFPNVEDFLIQYAAYQATKPFSEHQLMRTLMDATLPWLTTLIDSHTDQDEVVRRADALSEAERIRNRVLPLGFCHTVAAAPELLKAQSLIIVGWRPAVTWLLDKLCTHLIGAVDVHGVPFMLVRFMERAPRAAEQHAHLARIGGSAWAACADSEKKLKTCVGKFVLERLAALPDLLICDHLPAAYSEGFIGRRDAARAGDAHRCFRRWCNQVGSGFIGAVCLDHRETVTDLKEPEWEQLRTFTLLRSLSVEEKDDCYQLTLATTTWQAPKAEVDSVGSCLVMP